ncbi:PQQ-like beta-propeller repeat protein [candidate division KSB1 bacterium]|nr:PQQ-like beta-propeller repeat protein [candidate division KSB1 bacterium]
MNTLRAASALGIGCILVLACSNKKPDEPHTMPATTFTLNVLLSEGVEGYPSTGVYEYLPDDTVEYWYLLKPEFCNLTVTLDGRTMPAEGTFIIENDCDLRAASERKILWRFQTPNSVYYASPAVGDDGAIYFGSGLYTTDQGWSPGVLYALNPDGTLRWSREIGEAAYSPAIGNSGTIFIMDRTYTVRAFTAEGSLIWTFNDFVNPQFVKRDMGHRTPAIGSDGTVYIGADGLYALHPASGTKLWHVPRRRTPSKECIASPVIAADGTVYIVVGQDSLYAVQPDGSLKWAFGFDHDHELSFADPTIGDDGVIYVPTESYAAGASLYAVNEDGSLKWKDRIDDDRIVRASVTIAADGTLYLATKAGGDDGNARLIALSSSGNKLWHFVVEGRHVTGDDSYCTPSVGDNGMIYFGAETGYLYALNPDGTLAWKHEVASGVNWSSPAILADGTLLIGGMGYGPNYTGQFIAVIGSSHGHAVSAWPRFRRDYKNSGRFQ